MIAKTVHIKDTKKIVGRLQAIRYVDPKYLYIATANARCPTADLYIKEGDHVKALEREIEEEVGYHIEVLQELGEVKDYYNLIKRRNHNYFYLARRTTPCPQRLEEDEKKRINKIIWVPIDKAIRLYENMQNVLVGRIVKQRELPILKLAKSALQNITK